MRFCTIDALVPHMSPHVTRAHKPTSGDPEGSEPPPPPKCLGTSSNVHSPLLQLQTDTPPPSAFVETPHRRGFCGLRGGGGQEGSPPPQPPFG